MESEITAQFRDALRSAGLYSEKDIIEMSDEDLYKAIIKLPPKSSPKLPRRVMLPRLQTRAPQLPRRETKFLPGNPRLHREIYQGQGVDWDDEQFEILNAIRIEASEAQSINPSAIFNKM